MRRTILFVIIFALLLIPCLAQDIKTTGDNAAPQYRAPGKVVKESGFNIPKPEERAAATYSVRASTLEDYPIAIRSYSLSEPLDLKLEFYAMPADDPGLSPAVGIAVRRISAYIAEGKTFAYRFSGLVRRYTKEGFKIDFGAQVSTYYADEDGDGKFETHYLNKLPDQIPEWIPKDKDKSEKPPLMNRRPV